MSERTNALVEQFEQANKEAIAAIEQCSDADWNLVPEGEQRTVGVVAYHIAASHEGVAGLVQTIASGQALPPLTPDILHSGNAQQASGHADCTRQEVLDLFQKNATKAATMLGGLSDSQLDLTGTLFGRPINTQQLIENVLIGHVQEHTKTIKSV